MAITAEEMMDVSSKEDRGRTVRLDRKLKLSGISSIADGLSAIDEILGSPAVPPAGQTILINGWLLYLVSRDVKMDERPDLAEVALSYEGGIAPGGNETRRGGDVSVAQFTARSDREGNEMVVTHLGIAKRVTADVYMPLASPWIETFESTNDPDGLASTWSGVVNSAPFRGKKAGAWLVSRVTWDEVNPGASPQLWRFRWQFQEAPKSQGWLPRIAWIDPETNEMPPGLVEGVGIMSVPWYYQRDYNTKFA